MILQLLITIGVSQALSLAVMLLWKKQKSQADFLLSIELLLLFLITILFNYKVELDAIWGGAGMNSLVLAYLALPVFYFYVKAAAHGKLNPKKWYNWMHFVPFVAVVILMYTQYYSLPVDERCCMVENMNTHDHPLWFDAMYFGLFLVMFPIYLFLPFRVLKKHEAYILTKFSYTEDINLGWLNRFLWGNIILWLSFLIFEVIGTKWTDLLPADVGFLPGFIVIVFLVLYLGIYGQRQGIIFDSESTPLLEDTPEIQLSVEEKYQSSSLTDQKADRYLEQLQQFMEREKPFLESKITIAKLAERTGIPVNYLSQIINERLDQNFFDFVNSYRVNEFKSLLEQPENSNYTLLSLAHDAGFNSKSTFNAIFKKFTGQTPSEYARSKKAGLTPGNAL